MSVNINIDRIEPGQYALRIDPRFGIIMPWYTHGMLDYIAAKDFSNANVLEWGGGCSTFWWSRAAKKVFTIEAHQEWCDWINQTAHNLGFTNIHCERRWPEPNDKYVDVMADRYDVVCIDGSAREICLETALKMPRPLTIIFDNWQQDGVFMDANLEQVMEQYRQYGHFFIQADHTAHEGHPWQTAIWELP